MDARVNVRSVLASAAWRWRRVRYARALSGPYLSGDLFRSFCDVALDVTGSAQRRRFEQEYRRARTIFVKTDLLEQFLEDFARDATACRVLITGNSDREIHGIPKGLPPQLRRWFAQNTFVTSDVIRPLPIGLENHALGRNGRLCHFRTCTAQEVAAKKLRMFTAFAPRAPEREGLLQLLGTSSLVDAPARRLAPGRFQARLREYRFVIAPRGNGLDTHRFWESLYADAVPITRRTAWSRALKADGVPCIEVESWQDVLSWTQEDLARLSAAWSARLSTAPWLWEPFWRARIAAVLDQAPEPPEAVSTP